MPSKIHLEDIQRLGGLDIQQVDLNSPCTSFASGVYQYAFYKLGKNESLSVKASLYVTVVPVSELTQLEITDSHTKNIHTVFATQNYFQGDVTDLKITSLSENSVFVIGSKALTQNASATAPQTIDYADCKCVVKPWGYEFWLTGETPQHYAFKKILIRAGEKTSLQFHNEKCETNFLISGTANLYYAKDERQPPLTVPIQDILSLPITGPVVVDVTPLKIHRLEAVTDILLYEVSTLQLDDVVRLSDDTHRGNGRIAAEHNGQV